MNDLLGRLRRWAAVEAQVPNGGAQADLLYQTIETIESLNQQCEKLETLVADRDRQIKQINKHLQR